MPGAIMTLGILTRNIRSCLEDYRFGSYPAESSICKTSSETKISESF
jgi:hypothetical protein